MFIELNQVESNCAFEFIQILNLNRNHAWRAYFSQPDSNYLRRRKITNTKLWKRTPSLLDDTTTNAKKSIPLYFLLVTTILAIAV